MIDVITALDVALSALSIWKENERGDNEESCEGDNDDSDDNGDDEARILFRLVWGLGSGVGRRGRVGGREGIGEDLGVYFG